VLRLHAAAVVVLTTIITTVPACTAKPPEIDYMRVTVGGETSLGMTKRDAAPRGVVIFFHGLDRDETVLMADGPHRALTEQLVNSGFAVVASRAGGNSYGNPASQRTYRALAENAAKHYRVANVFLLAESMGAIAAANLLASRNQSSIRGLAAISPVLNLGQPPPEHQAAIAASYPGQSPESVDPMRLPANDFRGKHMRFYVTPTDSLVPSDANALAFQARFAPVADISIVPCTGPHLDPSCIRGDDIVRWFSHLESNENP
jgi:pimeloyl-ACP methyl ester carboxylesterase